MKLKKLILTMSLIALVGPGCVSKDQHNLRVSKVKIEAAQACLDAYTAQENRQANEREALVNRLKVVEAEKAALAADRDEKTERLLKFNQVNRKTGALIKKPKAAR